MQSVHLILLIYLHVCKSAEQIIHGIFSDMRIFQIPKIQKISDLRLLWINIVLLTLRYIMEIFVKLQLCLCLFYNYIWKCHMSTSCLSIQCNCGLHIVSYKVKENIHISDHRKQNQRLNKMPQKSKIIFIHESAQKGISWKHREGPNYKFKQQLKSMPFLNVSE